MLFIEVARSALASLLSGMTRNDFGDRELDGAGSLIRVLYELIIRVSRVGTGRTPSHACARVAMSVSMASEIRRHATTPLQLQPREKRGTFDSRRLNSRRFLTYGSACQDCGFNNQRIDLEEAARIALATNRTLVVRNFLCSPHSPCPSSNATSDGVIAALGGVTAWRKKCNSHPSFVCDKGEVKKDDGTPWGSGVHFLDARLFVDPAYFWKRKLPFLWSDEFHSMHSELVQPGAADSWVMVQRKLPLSKAERKAPVWHVAHLHKGSSTSSFANGVPKKERWPPRIGLRYAPWLHHVAHKLAATMRERHGVRDFACVHCRLGDWGVSMGLSDADFRPKLYAIHLSHMISRAAPTLPSSGLAPAPRTSLITRLLRLLRAPQPPPPRPLIYLATQRKSMHVILPSLHLVGEVESLESVQTARRVAEAGVISEPTEDIFACIEQLVCLRSSVFVGTPGSTMTQYVHTSRAAERIKAIATGKPHPYLGNDIFLSPRYYYLAGNITSWTQDRAKTKVRRGAEREKLIREYWGAQQVQNRTPRTRTF